MTCLVLADVWRAPCESLAFLRSCFQEDLLAASNLRAMASNQVDPPHVLRRTTSGLEKRVTSGGLVTGPVGGGAGLPRST